MKWFFKWLRNGLDTLDRENKEEEKEWLDKYRASPGLAISMPKVKAQRASQTIGTRDDNIHLNTQAMHFRIYPATGGHIVEYSYYDEKRDQNQQALHLIPSELDMGAELAKIMTLEALKR